MRTRLWGYVVDPVTGTVEQPGLDATVTLAAGTTGRAVTLDWSGSCPPYSGVTAYKVYGRTPGAEEQLLDHHGVDPMPISTDTGAGSAPRPIARP